MPVKQNFVFTESKRYEKFITLWEDTDLGLPEVEDVRKRLAGLKEPMNKRSHN